MSRIIRFSSVACALCAALFSSCQQNAPSRGGTVGVRTYSDAVVHISQVDPAYRAYFQEQNASNYSLSDQRKAYIAATEVARTPVRESDYRPVDVRRTKRTVVYAKSVRGAKPTRLAVVRGKVAKTSTKSRLVAKAAKPAAAKRAVAVRKPYRKR